MAVSIDQQSLLVIRKFSLISRGAQSASLESLHLDWDMVKLLARIFLNVQSTVQFTYFF